MYRYLVCTLGISSRELVRLLPPEKLDDMAIAYELYNTEDAVKKIAESIGY